MPSKEWDVETVQVCVGDEGHKHDLVVAAGKILDIERTLHNIANVVGKVPNLKMPFIAMRTKIDEVVQIKRGQRLSQARAEVRKQSMNEISSSQNRWWIG